MLKLLVVVLLAALVVLLAAGVIRNIRFERETALRVQQVKDQPYHAPTRLSLDRELAGLPAPVQRYFRAVLTDRMALPQIARIAHAGEFLMRAQDGWVRFVSVEHFNGSPPGFVWDARMDMAPGVKVKVRDAFVDGTGYMTAAVLGAVTVMDVHGTPAIAQGALTRYLAEGPWFPPILLPSRGVRWSPIDDTSARATVTAGATTVSVDFHFDAAGLVTRVYCPDRMRDVDGTGVPTPWQGRMRDYDTFAGMRIPRVGEVAWLLPEGEQVYWKGRVTGADFH